MKQSKSVNSNTELNTIYLPPPMLQTQCFKMLTQFLMSSIYAKDQNQLLSLEIELLVNA